MGDGDTPTAPDLTELRILGFCDHFTETMSGGVEIVTREVYRRLADQGAQIRVVSVVPGHNAAQYAIEGIPTRSVRGFDLSPMLRSQVTVAKGVHKTARVALETFTPHVLHASSIHFRGAREAARLARGTGLPLVTTAHIGSPAALPTATRIGATVFERLVGARILQASQRVIAVSHTVADHLETLGVTREKITVVNNGVDHRRFQPQHSSDPGVRIAFIGRLIANKGPLQALRAFAEASHPDTRLIFAGDGPMRRRLETEATRLDVDDRVTFLGRVDDVAKVTRSADVIIRPSLTEGQSLALLEGMAAAKCTIASNIPANVELIEDGVSGLLTRPGDVDDLADKLSLVLEDPHLRERLADAGYRRSLEYSWERCATETGAVLAAAAGTGRHDG